MCLGAGLGSAVTASSSFGGRAIAIAIGFVAGACIGELLEIIFRKTR
jgi:hypothetical protein